MLENYKKFNIKWYGWVYYEKKMYLKKIEWLKLRSALFPDYAQKRSGKGQLFSGISSEQADKDCHPFPDYFQKRLAKVNFVSRLCPEQNRSKSSLFRTMPKRCQHCFQTKPRRGWQRWEVAYQAPLPSGIPCTTG